mgnify:CR=1 FL=1
MHLFHLMLLLIPIMYVAALCVGMCIAISGKRTAQHKSVRRRNHAKPDCARGACNAQNLATGRVGVARPIAGEQR